MHHLAPPPRGSASSHKDNPQSGCGRRATQLLFSKLPSSKWPAMASPQTKDAAPSEDGRPLPIPVWMEDAHATPLSTQPPPLVSDDGLQVVARKPLPVDGLHVVSHEPPTEAPPPPYESPTTGRCLVLPSRAAEWRVKSADRDVRLCTLAAAVLVREGVLDGTNVEL